MSAKIEKRDLAAEITAKILASLDAGTAPWRMPWATNGATIGGLPFSVTSRKRYSGINVWLLMLAQQAHGFRSSGWITYRAAAAHGGQVRAGSKGTAVTFYKTLTKNERDAQTGEESQKRIPLMRCFTAFNLDQVDGLPDELLAKHTPSPERIATTEAADWFAARLPGLRIEHGHGAACYVPSGDVVRLPAHADFSSEGAYFGTLAHECTHASGVASRLDRSTLRDYHVKAERAAEELTADIGASLISARLGRDFDAGNHESYLASWAELLRNDKRAIMRAASQAQKACDYICGAQEEEAAHDEAK